VPLGGERKERKKYLLGRHLRLREGRFQERGKREEAVEAREGKGLPFGGVGEVRRS